MPVIADPLVFCPVCGARLDEADCAHDSDAQLPPTASSTFVAGAGESSEPVGAGRRGHVLTACVAVVALGVAAFGVVDHVRLTEQLDGAAREVASLTEALDGVAMQVESMRQGDRRVAGRVSLLEQAQQEPSVTARVAQAAQPSVFTVGTSSGTGSGFVVRTRGGESQVLTNFHVVAQGYTNGDLAVKVRQGRKSYDGRVVDVSEANDLALISVPNTLPALQFASSPPPVGDSVVVLGSPLGLGRTVTSGIVSAYRSMQEVEYLQFSAPISPGNSGGPVLDSEGKVVGVTVQKMVGGGAEGIGFAVPLDRVCVAFDVC